MIRIFFILGIIGGAFAFLMAFIIAYEEYKHHFKGSVIKKEAFSIAIMAFFILLFLMIISGFFLSTLFSNT